MSCSVEGCLRRAGSRGMCNLHYLKWYKNTPPEDRPPLPPRPSALERFLPKITESESGCWLWTASLTKAGYGLFSVKHKKIYAHRWSYEHFVGPISEGLTIDHLCRNTACANPEHLEAVTMGENVRRGTAGLHQAAKTHCPHGHPYEGDNVFKDNRGRRRCKTCKREKDRRR